jgi:thymidylate synthase
MPYTPHLITANDFQVAWELASKELIRSDRDLHNLIVQIQNPTLYDDNRNNLQNVFAENCKILLPKHVAYTIFPHQLYKQCNNDAEKLFTLYNKKGGLYQRLHFLNSTEWGTYFRKMTYYENSKKGIVNQLQNIITSINKNPNYKAAHFITIQEPTKAIRLRGSPCLNYIAIQCNKIAKEPTLGLLAVYRNHDFLERAYGNYWGLCNLQQFIAAQVKMKCGPLTCISSHAYVSGNKCNLRNFLNTLT